MQTYSKASPVVHTEIDHADSCKVKVLLFMGYDTRIFEWPSHSLMNEKHEKKGVEGCSKCTEAHARFCYSCSML